MFSKRFLKLKILRMYVVNHLIQGIFIYNYNHVCRAISVCFLTLRQCLFMNLLLIIGGIEQNPGPAKQNRNNRRLHRPHLPQWSSLSRLHRSSSYDVSSLPSSFTSVADESGITQLLTSMQAHVNSSMSYMQKQLTGLNDKIDNVTSVCKELQLETEKLRNQNKEMHRKIQIFEARLEYIEHTAKGNEADKTTLISDNELMNKEIDFSDLYIYDFVGEQLRPANSGEEDATVSDRLVTTGTDTDGLQNEKKDYSYLLVEKSKDTGTAESKKGKIGNMFGILKDKKSQQEHKTVNGSNYVRSKTEERGKLCRTETKTDWVLPLLHDKNRDDKFDISQKETSNLVLKDTENYDGTRISVQIKTKGCMDSDKVNGPQFLVDGKQYSSEETELKGESLAVDNEDKKDTMYSRIMKKTARSIWPDEVVSSDDFKDFKENDDSELLTEDLNYSVPLPVAVEIDNSSGLQKDNLYNSIPVYTRRNRRLSLPILPSYTSLVRKFSASKSNKFLTKSSCEMGGKNSSASLSRSVSFSDKVGIL